VVAIAIIDTADSDLARVRISISDDVGVSVSVNSLIRNSRVRKIHTTYNTVTVNVNMTTSKMESFGDGYFFGQK